MLTLFQCHKPALFYTFGRHLRDLNGSFYRQNLMSMVEQKMTVSLFLCSMVVSRKHWTSEEKRHPTMKVVQARMLRLNCSLDCRKVGRGASFYS